MATNHSHPDVFHLRWHIYARAGEWDACLDIATTLTKTTPKQPFSWASRAESFHELGRTRQAKRLLLRAGKRFRSDSGIAYYLARYSCALGAMVDAMDWLGRAISNAESNPEQLERRRSYALEDPVLEPLWRVL